MPVHLPQDRWSPEAAGTGWKLLRALFPAVFPVQAPTLGSSPEKLKTFPWASPTTQQLSCGWSADDLLPGLHRGYSNVPSTHCTLKGEDAGSFTYPLLHLNSTKSPDVEYSFLPLTHFSSILLLLMSSSDAVQATWKRQEQSVITSYTCTMGNFFPLEPTQVLCITKSFQLFALCIC